MKTLCSKDYKFNVVKDFAKREHCETQTPLKARQMKIVID